MAHKQALPWKLYCAYAAYVHTLTDCGEENLGVSPFLFFQTTFSGKKPKDEQTVKQKPGWKYLIGRPVHSALPYLFIATNIPCLPARMQLPGNKVKSLPTLPSPPTLFSVMFILTFCAPLFSPMPHGIAATAISRKHNHSFFIVVVVPLAKEYYFITTYNRVWYMIRANW